jgi:hypothetical protein
LVEGGTYREIVARIAEQLERHRGGKAANHASL